MFCCCSNEEKKAEVITVDSEVNVPVAPQKQAYEPPPEPTPAPAEPEPAPPPPVKEEPPETEPAAPEVEPAKAAPADDNYTEIGPNEFKIKMVRGDTSDASKKIGANVSHVNNGSKDIALVIKGMREGMFQTWNIENPTKEIKKGDHIVEVNGVRGDSKKMIERIVGDRVLEATFRRMS